MQRENQTIVSFKLMFIFLLFNIPVFSYSQISATLLTPAQSIYTLSQIGQLQIRNSGAPDRIQLKLLLRNKTEDIYTAEYSNIPVGTGIQLLNTATLTPIVKEFGRSAAAKELNISGRLLYGDYILCFQINENGTNNSYPEDCINFRVRPISPIRLLMPFDKATIYTSDPLLVWLPPSPLVSGVSYNLRLAQIDSGQTALDAIERNPILFSVDHLATNSLIYPPTATSLMKGKKYAWQVEAYYNENSIGVTEAWEFTYLKEQRKKPDSATSYYKAKLVLDGTYCTADPNLHFIIPHIKANQKIVLNLYNSMNQSVEIFNKKLLRISLHYGDNLFSLPIGQIARLGNNQIYFLKAHTVEGVYFIAFRYIDANK